MKFETRALGFRIKTSEMEEPGEFLDKLVQEHLSFYENAENHDKGESAELIFEGGSKAFILRLENNEDELEDEITINYLPGEEEKNYEQSKEIIETIDDALTGIGYEIEYMTVGGLIEEEMSKLLKKHISVESEFEVDGIELKKDDCIYAIADKENSKDKLRVTIRTRDSEKDMNALREKLYEKLEEFVEEEED